MQVPIAVSWIPLCEHKLLIIWYAKLQVTWTRIEPNIVKNLPITFIILLSQYK